ncbi:hypothetical protein A2797_02320 [candidate division WWE3 bacterium RIFCSPHIGHO2_01_FULL_48_15]|uniref:Cell envelope-related transcriptional attenuator domain-containing protein n=1 Tax=candidate division WWE3 bacterium RIFCSPHIGHO2_01_FULL_48_15 TaxID=1802619 RepID=A0A1F4VBT7_UNCKA|nr:MAG: hypothetical protein A2797_02320 [candidate division WWE3 bacterium RIFCSPHIGHO2_01_FULL_48_15]
MNRQIDFDKGVKRRSSRGRRAIIAAGILALVASVGIILAKVDLLSPISFVAQLVSPTQLKETDGRVNALILGLDSRGGTGLLNTDTILVGSLSVTGEEPVLISVPRDFWISLAPYSYGRINSAYSVGGTQKDGSFDEGEGAEFAKGKIEGVLGIPIHYFAVIDFEGFKEVIETVGGVEVCVERAFDDYSYPVPGHESDPIISRRYEHLHFNSGCQLMDEETALKYARSRTGTNGEGNDFARVRRQQNVIMGVKDKIFSLNLLTDSGKIVKLYQQFSKSLRTNMTLGELKRALEIAQKVVDFAQVKSLVLDPDSQLVYHPDPASYGGAYVLVPTGGNYEKIHSAIRGLLFVGKTDAEAQSE